MNLLILGGTVFLGRALTDHALARGHDVTHLNRGRAPDARVRTLIADRKDAVALATALGNCHWDAVIDTCGYMPEVVRFSLARLQRATSRYVFISTISVYSGTEFHEGAAVPPPPDPLPDAVTPKTYGALKAMCESVVRDVMGHAATIVRPGLMVGPHDPTDRFTYWPVRLARGGRVFAPGRPERNVQFIDVRDLASWTLRLAEDDVSGRFNATGPATPLTMGELLEECVRVNGSGATLEWADDRWLLDHGVAPWSEMPLWLPEADGAGFMRVPITRALATGLKFRPIDDTIRDTLAWEATRPPDHEWKAGITAQREADLLRDRSA